MGKCYIEMVKLVLDSIIEEKKWKECANISYLKKQIKNILQSVFKILNTDIKKELTIEVSLTLTNDANIQKINKEYRNIDKPTNVLSFPMYEKEFFDIIKYDDFVGIGDIVLSLETLLRECEEQKITFEYHLNHLITHSILHLFGYDHIKDDEAEEMEKLEMMILKDLGIK